MINRTTKLRWRRRYRRGRAQVEDISSQAEEHIDRHIFKRLSKLLVIRRFLASWVGLIILLIGITLIQAYNLSPLYQRLAPAPGGNFSEGIVGNYTNANPLFASNDVDTSVSRLIFAGLFKYDESNHLVPDLAENYTSDDRGQNYTVTLKPNLRWQDGRPLTAKDVVFTFETIQNPDVQSPLFQAWQGVTIKAVNDQTIQFSLPDPLASFPYNLTTGLIPEHLLSNVSPNQMRSNDFDTIGPIGAGPFKYQAIQVEGNTTATRQVQVGLEANPLYYAGKPKLDRFTIDTFNDQARMLASFKTQNIDAMAGVDSLPSKLANNSSIYSYNIPLTAEVMVFFKSSQPILSDVKVRQALTEATNETNIISGLGYPVIPARGPLLAFQFAYNPSITQLTTNVAQAKTLLTQDGWVVGKGGVRYKSGQPLQFQLFTQNSPDYNYVGQTIIQQWKAVGVDAQLIPQQSTDFQTTLGSHGYDALLYGISVGVDPDVYAYWATNEGTAQANPRTNFSEYASGTADAALQGGRTRTDTTLRTVKYVPFLQSWQSDAPAVALYQPRFLYVVHNKIYNFSPTMVNSPADRYDNVANWEIRQVKTSNSI